MSLYNKLMDLVYDVTCAALELNSDTSPQNILPLNYTESPAGLKDPHKNYVFYAVQFEGENINRQLDDLTVANTNPALTTRRVRYVRNLRIIWQTYGDDGFEWADTLRIMLFDSTIQQMFAVQGISLITDVSEPVYIPEKIGQQWYKRYDFSAKFNQLVTKETNVPAVSGTEIIVVDEKGVVSTCSVSDQ